MNTKRDCWKNFAVPQSLNKPSHKSIVVGAANFIAMKDMALEHMPTKYKSQACICSNNLFFF